MAGVLNIENISSGSSSLKTKDIIMCTARAWVYFTDPGIVLTVKGSYNVSSVSEHGTGDYTINFAEPLKGSDYAVVATASQASSASGATSASIMVEGKLNSTTLAKKDRFGVRMYCIDNNQDKFFDAWSANVVIYGVA